MIIVGEGQDCTITNRSCVLIYLVELTLCSGSLPLDRDEAPVAVSAPPRDLVMLATALGAYATHVTEPADLTAEIRAARSRSGPTVIVVPELLREEAS